MGGGGSGFDPGNMPDMGSFSPPDSSGGADQDAQQDAGSQENKTEQGSDADSRSETKRPSFSGMQGQSSSQAKVKNLITFGVCLAVMIAALVIVVLFKRRRKK